MKEYFLFDDEYITGNQYFIRHLISLPLSLILIGFLLSSATAYKRAKSLGNSNFICVIWAIWGALNLPLSLNPIWFLTNTIPYWYLWWTDGLRKLK